ncbi:MAG: type 4a pilus biogenesis protein PilO [Thermoanaerobaculia bacterium]|nr:type 4a pilus biogenesis protein PilO [Thermoanaerobaculia bacterium]
MALEAIKDKPWYVGLGVGLAIAAVLFGLAHWRLYEPQKKRIASQDRKLEGLQAKIQEGRAAKARLPQFREEVRRLELELEKLLRILPAQLNTEDLLRRFRSLGEQGNLELVRIRPGVLSDRDFYREWPIEMTVGGSYHNLAIFFERIGRFPRIVNIDNLRVKADRAPTSGNTISATFVAKTFVYRKVDLEIEAPTAAAAP